MQCRTHSVRIHVQAIILKLFFLNESRDFLACLLLPIYSSQFSQCVVCNQSKMCAEWIINVFCHHAIGSLIQPSLKNVVRKSPLGVTTHAHCKQHFRRKLDRERWKCPARVPTFFFSGNPFLEFINASFSRKQRMRIQTVVWWLWKIPSQENMGTLDIK